MTFTAKSRLSFGALARHWPDGVPLIALGGPGHYFIVPVAFSEVGYDEVKHHRLASRPVQDVCLPFRSGYMGLVSYDQFAPTQLASAGPRIFRVDRALVQDLRTGEVHLTGDPAARAAFSVGPAVIDRLLADDETALPAPAYHLAAETSAAHYLAAVEQALSDIRAGRYYQINLLRYFRTTGDFSRVLLAARLDAMGGPHAAVFAIPGLELWSFSPERFLQLRPSGSDLIAEARPIKGTAARGETEVADRLAAEALQKSPKDMAELHMIIDLMRNDLARVSQRGSVAVPSTGHLLTVANVHHLEGVVTSKLRHGLTLGELFDATCPGGSVTGAPKQEVMRAIRDYEGRERGYFMGNAFYLDDSGAFDSSILIRTLVKRAGQKDYEFAAGSGIVMHSDPAAECREIDAKSRVLTASWT